MQNLYKVWGYQTELEEATCDNAPRAGLRCQEGEASLADLQALQYPALVSLTDETGGTYYATLVNLGPDKANLLIGNQSWQVDRQWLSDYWGGSYPCCGACPRGCHPDRQQRRPQPGAVARQRPQPGPAAAGSQGPPLRCRAQDQAAAVPACPGAEPDGIAGSNTLLRLNVMAGEPMPKLEDPAQRASKPARLDPVGMTMPSTHCRRRLPDVHPAQGAAAGRPAPVHPAHPGDGAAGQPGRGTTQALDLVAAGPAGAGDGAAANYGWHLLNNRPIEKTVEVKEVVTPPFVRVEPKPMITRPLPPPPPEPVVIPKTDAQPAPAPADSSQGLAERILNALNSTPLQQSAPPQVPEELQATPLSALPQALRQQVPPLAYGAHVFSSNPANRAVTLNGRTYREGSEVAPASPCSPSPRITSSCRWAARTSASRRCRTGAAEARPCQPETGHHFKREPESSL